MDIDLAALPNDVETLHRMVRNLAADRTALAEAQAEIERLRLIVQKLQRSQFGRRAERLPGNQLQFGFEDLEADLARAEADRSVGEDQDAESSDGSTKPAGAPGPGGQADRHRASGLPLLRRPVTPDR